MINLHKKKSKESYQFERGAKFDRFTLFNNIEYVNFFD